MFPWQPWNVIRRMECRLRLLPVSGFAIKGGVGGPWTLAVPSKFRVLDVPCVGVWLRLVEHCVRDAGVGGSNPLTPTKNTSLAG